MTNPQASSNTQYCPYCDISTDTSVKDSRPFMYARKYECVRRRRACPKCNSMFTTIEVPWIFISPLQPRIDAVDELIAWLQTERERLLLAKRREEVDATMRGHSGILSNAEKT